jgi:hypothetical protein
MSYTLSGRIESRIAAALLPLLVAGVLAALGRDWWPVELALFMLGVGLVLDVAFYHRLLPYQPGWLALPLGALELALVMALVRALGIEAPLLPALALFAFAWLVAQILGHAVFPLARLSYGEDGGELGQAGPPAAAAALAVVAFAGGVAWATAPPTIRLAAGTHDGPIVIDRAQTLAGEPGAVVRGGIVVRADNVTVRDVTVVGGEVGIAVEDSVEVVLDDVTILRARMDGISARQSSLVIRDCIVRELAPEHTQAIDISFAHTLPSSRVEGCHIEGGAEGIATQMANIEVRENVVRGTTLRAISLNEMSMGVVAENDVRDALGIAILCMDYSHCEIVRNRVSRTRSDVASQSKSRAGYAVVSHYGSAAIVRDNQLAGNAADVGVFVNSTISSG